MNDVELEQPLIGQRITLEALSVALGVDPVIARRETVTWIQFDARMGVGINAMLATHDAEADLEPYDCMLAVYQTAAGMVSDRDRVSTLVAALDFVRDEHDPILLVVETAQLSESFDDLSLEDVLSGLRRILADYPYHRDKPF